MATSTSPTTTGTAPRSRSAAPDRTSEPSGSPPASPGWASSVPWRPVMAGVATVGVTGLVLLAVSLTTGADSGDDGLVFHTVRKGELLITVTERGTLQSQSNTEVMCEVDDVSGDGISGTEILWIVPNGSQVKKGDLLVELDASSHREQFDDQILDTERAEAAYRTADAQLENRKSQNKTNLYKAKLNVQLCELALEQFENEEGGGTFQIQLQDVELAIKQAEESSEIASRNLGGTRILVDLGYKTEGDLEQARFQSLNAETRLERQRNEKKRLREYMYEREQKVLDGELKSAKRALRQVVENNKSRLAQAEIEATTAERRWNREKERLERYREQLDNCKIYAPCDGMVAYKVESSRWGSSSTIAEGQAVRDRQVLMTIPDLSSMEVKLSVHESVVDRVQQGLPATVRIDAVPDKTYGGEVESVAVLPDPGGWLSSNIKVYETIVAINEEVTQLKPGMTAVVEVQVARLQDILTVPVQALVQRGSETWCYVADGRSPRKQLVEVGRTNDKFVEIVSGVNAGDRVVLNPSAILEVQESKKTPISADTKRDQEVSLE